MHQKNVQNSIEKWKAGLLLSIVLLSIGILLSGCSGGYDSAGDSSTANEATDTDSYDLGATSDQQASPEKGEPNSSASNKAYERKIIREQYIEQQVQDLQGVLANIEAKVNQTQGAYIESLEEWQTEQRQVIQHRASIVIRIPTESFQSFLADIESQGAITKRQVKGQDVTNEFVDNESRLRNLKTHEERILKLYEQAKTIDEMLKLESELSRIREQVEVLEGRQQYLRHVTSTVKLAVELYQVEEEEMIAANDPSVLSASWAGFNKSLKQLKWLGEQTIIVFMTLFPYLLIIAAIGSVIFWLIRKGMIPVTKKKTGPPSE